MRRCGKISLVMTALSLFWAYDSFGGKATTSTSPARSGSPTELSSSVLAGMLSSSTISCSETTFTLGSVSGSSVSAKCYTYAPLADSDYPSCPTGAVYEMDYDGRTDQCVTASSGRTETTYSGADYACPSGYTVKRQSGLDICYKVTNGKIKVN